ncbi:FAD-binding domain-containing protein [Lentithecium fluviatile CBS 122367]|uniref:FAD-binding domain-containing protein n=1 Tax=Lentithecium fluviatile CBS 122367 TaxID=1168545 RepID=A0A6G1J762_9PLEO|nr:FAD-binding domain-containing protein [Lentithecium fluviatile CBS 122367]
MRLAVSLLAAAVLSAEFTLAQNISLSEQLLQTLDEFPSTDPLVSELYAAIESATNVLDNTSIVLDNTLTERSLLQPTSRAKLACSLLKVTLQHWYTDPTDQTAYDVLRLKNWSNNCDLPAACFLTPVHPVQVAVALQIITFTQSKFAVRSGGHNPNPGFAGVGEEGVTIDMQGFTTLQLSADKSRATVGAGLRFGAVQSYLDQYQVAVVSGRNNYVGVSGLLLGGGHPIINSLTGLAADNIVSTEVVLSSARVVKASRTENSDLFRALKGGGNNFGIVTKVELKTSMPRNIWYRIAVYGASNPRAVFDALVEVQKRMEADPKAGIAITCSPTAFSVTFVYGEYINDPEVFAPFRSLAAISETKAPTNGTTVEFIKLQSPPQPEGIRDTVGVTTYLDTDLYMEIYKQYLATANAAGGPTTAFLLPIQTFGAASAQIAEKNGGNVLGTSQKAQTWWNPIAQWTDPAASDKVHSALLSLADAIKSAAQAKGLYDEYIFANIAAHDQDVLGSYGQQNVDFLQTVSRKYDWLGTFQRLQNGGFRI